MIKSMTAYAAAESVCDAFSVSIEIRSYNSRHLDIVLRMPSGYLALEEKLKELISARVVRGRLEVKIYIEIEASDAPGFEIDRAKARSLYTVLNEICDEFKLSHDISLETLIHVGGIIKPVDVPTDTDAVFPVLRDGLDQALTALEKMRKREGDFIARDLFKRLDHIEQQLKKVKTGSSGLIDAYQQRLKERISVLTQNVIEIDPGRIAQEAAILADRSDVSEEIVRSESHLKQFRQIMQNDEAAGRKLNFLLQEFHREFNTMGAKVGNADVSHLIIDVKSELEKMREQIQNIE
jgi:uncharacterized protein (TIGR00255 family)